MMLRLLVIAILAGSHPVLEIHPLGTERVRARLVICVHWPVKTEIRSGWVSLVADYRDLPGATDG